MPRKKRLGRPPGKPNKPKSVHPVAIPKVDTETFKALAHLIQVFANRL